MTLLASTSTSTVRSTGTGHTFSRVVVQFQSCVLGHGTSLILRTGFRVQSITHVPYSTVPDLDQGRPNNLRVLGVEHLSVKAPPT